MKALVPATVIAIALNFTPGVGDLAHFSLFIGGIAAALLFWALASRESAVGAASGSPAADTSPATSDGNASQ